MQEIPKRALLLNLILSQLIVVIIGILLLVTVAREVEWVGFFHLSDGKLAVAGLTWGSAALWGLQVLFHKFVPKEKLWDPINVMLMEKFSLPELALLFLVGAVAEEFLFRGVLQSILGIGGASLLFTAIHFRYWRKGYMILEVLLMGLILGLIYQTTSMLWVSVICHFILNWVTAFMVKKGYMEA